MNKIDISKTVLGIIDSYFPLEEKSRLSLSDKLHIILSESTQALSLITTLEDEFEIEFDDDDIDMEFFLSSDTITNKVIECLER